MIRIAAASIILACGILAAGCGGNSTQNSCTITAVITPANATADHAAAAPANQVQFMTMGSASGNCSLQPSAVGTWSTSDAVNTSLSNQTANTVVATCVNATASPVTISNSGTVNGQGFTPAKLSCH